MRVFQSSLCLAVFGVSPILAQTPVIAGAGYIDPTSPFWVAPGQVMKVYISGTKTLLPSIDSEVHAKTVPLPTSLGGFSVTIRQPGGFAGPGQASNTYAAPLFSVNQTPRCAPPADPSSPLWPDCVTTEITLQIPFEITPLVPGDLSVTDNGTESVHIPLNPLPGNIHVFTDCDAKGVRTASPMVCSATATHINGVPISIDEPATAGETIVVYATGLGATTSAVTTGAATPSPAPVLVPSAIPGDGIKIQFDFRPNAAPAWPYTGSGGANPPPVAPVFAGLTPGAVGLYQINVKLPDLFPPMPPCADASASEPLSAVVRTNLTVSLTSQVVRF